MLALFIFFPSKHQNFKKSRANMNSDQKVTDFDCAACTPLSNQNWWPCCSVDGPPLCEGLAGCVHEC